MEKFGLGREGRTVVIAAVLKITMYLRYRQLSVGSTTVGALYKRLRHHRDSTSNTRLRVYAHTYEAIKRNTRERKREKVNALVRRDALWTDAMKSWLKSEATVDAPFNYSLSLSLSLRVELPTWLWKRFSLWCTAFSFTTCFCWVSTDFW